MRRVGNPFTPTRVARLLHRVLHQPATLSTQRRDRAGCDTRGSGGAINSLKSWTWSRVSPGPGCRRRKRHVRRGGNSLITTARLAPVTLLLAAALAAPALAQGGPKPAPTRVPAQAPVLRMSQSPDPTFDEGTNQRMAAAMLSYSALEVQGGWPMLPPSAQARSRLDRSGRGGAAPAARHHRRSAGRSGQRRGLRRRARRRRCGASRRVTAWRRPAASDRRR